MFCASKSLGKAKNVFSINNCIRYAKTTRVQLTEDCAEEIKIPVPWGHIAGKWWGNQNLPPLLAIHGWQDNANSFDKLIPLLNVPSILAIDLPGHGYSSHIPEGKAYDFGEYLISLHRIIKYYNWNSLSFLTHSFGGALGFAYTSMFPKKINMFINFECARSLLTLSRINLPEIIASEINKIFKIEEQKKNILPPAYKLSTLIRMTVEGTLGSVSSPEAAITLLKRSTKPVDNYSSVKKNMEKNLFSTDLTDLVKFEKLSLMSLSPEHREKAMNSYASLLEGLEIARAEINNYYINEADDKYFIFTRDPFIKVLLFETFDDELVIEASKKIVCPFLSMRAKNGFLHGSSGTLYDKTLEILKNNSNYLEHHEVDGKWWGSKNKQPVLCIHGWQDNANTFDTLIPLLSSKFSYLAIDLPGHGVSSHLPKGLLYRNYEVVSVIKRIQNHFKWNKVFLMGHSYGAACSFVFSSCFPKDTEFFIAIDNLKPLSRQPKQIIDMGSEKIEQILLYESFSPESTPCYNKNDLMQKWIKGSDNSLTEKSCLLLMQRGAYEVDDLLKLNRDSRVKTTVAYSFSQKECLKLAESVVCNVLFIKAKDSPYFEKKENVLNVLSVLKNKAKYFQYNELPGTHHLHLNTPEVVAPVINLFISNIMKPS